MNDRSDAPLEGETAVEGAPAGWPMVPEGGRLLALVPDLMDRSKIASARPGTVFLSGPSALVDGDLVAADVVLVDLHRPAVLDQLARCPARVIGFVSHVDTETADQARSAGVEVLARSAFFRRLQGSDR